MSKTFRIAFARIARHIMIVGALPASASFAAAVREFVFISPTAVFVRDARSIKAIS